VVWYSIEFTLPFTVYSLEGGEPSALGRAESGYGPGSTMRIADAPVDTFSDDGVIDRARPAQAIDT
jgi:hypothetical protein